MSGCVLAIVGSVSLEGNEEAWRHVLAVIQKYNPVRIVSGGAAGVDTMADKAAKGKRIAFTEHRPGVQAWCKGEPDGFEARNLLVAQDCTRLVRIVASDSKTYGSGWTRDRAAEMGKPTEEFIVQVKP